MLYQDKKVTVIGLGKTGLSCVDFLLKQGANIRVIDTRTNPPGADQLVHKAEIPLHTGGLNMDWLLDSDIIVISPGLAVKTPEIQTALQAGVEVIGDIELFCRAASKPIVAITGSNGKSTVTTLVTEMAKAGVSGTWAWAWHIGIPALSLLDEDYDFMYWSDPALTRKPPDSVLYAATVLNVTEDHMNRYVDLEDYRQAKLKIYQHCQTAVVNAEDRLTCEDGQQSAQYQVSFIERQADYWLKLKMVSNI